MMNNYKFNHKFSLKTLWCVLLGMMITPVSALLAQTPSLPSIVYDLAAPSVKTFAITDQGYTTTFANVKWQEQDDNGLLFYEILTWEYDVKTDGNFSLCNAKILPQSKEKSLGFQAYLDEYLSQSGWSAMNAKSSPEGIILDPSALNLPPNVADYSPYCHAASPFLFLRNGDKKYTVSLDLKVLSSEKDEAVFAIHAYGQELPNDQSEVRKISVPNDGQIHHFDVEFTNGTWNHRIVLYPVTKSSFALSKTIQISQNLKKGDHVYRSVYYNHYDKTALSPGNEKNDHHTTYTYANNKINKNLLDVKKANDEGAYLAYRMLYRYLYNGYIGRYIYYSMFSEPYYLPGQNDPASTNPYVYLGYVEKEPPVSNNVAPASAFGAYTRLGAIKIPEEMSKSLKEKGAKVVGVRFCVGAKRQLNQWFEVVDSVPDLPFAFLAENLKMSSENSLTKNEFLLKKRAPIGEGWNELFFDTPYPITNKDFYVGFGVYDPSEAGRVYYLSDKVMDAGPYSHLSAYCSHDPEEEDVVDYSAYNEADFRKDNYTEQAFLIQAIVQIKDDVEDAEIYSVKGEEFYFSDKPLSYKVEFKNIGNIDINSIKAEVGVEGNTEIKEFTFNPAISSGEVKEASVTLSKFPTPFGKTQLGVRIIEINGKAFDKGILTSFDTELVDASKVFTRNAMVEIFTNENCNNCPFGEKSFFEEFNVLPEEVKTRTIFVFHHEALGTDLFSMKYSSTCLPFFGVRNNNGELVIASGTPRMMINRMKNPYLRTQENGFMGGLPTLEKVASSFDYALNKVPAFGLVKLGAKYQADSTIHVVVSGKLSEALDKNTPVYLTLLMTQESLPAVDQRGAKPGFFHSCVLRYVDEKGFMGTKVEVDKDNRFEKVYNINPDLIAFDDIEDLRVRKIRDNQLIMLDKNGEAITKKQTLENVNIIAFLHYAQELPGIYDLTLENPEIHNNAIINAAQTKITNLDLAAQSVSSVDEDFHFENGKLVYTIPCASLSVYTLDGVRLDPQQYFEPGTYILTAVLKTGQKVTKKLICDNSK